MKQYLKIESIGEIEEQAFTLLGASPKRGDDTKIGMFGSGLKYAISSLIRNNIPFYVMSGEKEVVFGKKQVKFREKDFEIITVNGKETSLTTSMGGTDWDSAFAPFREIYSNALDEDENAKLDLVSEDKLEYKKGYTTFFIEAELPSIKEFYHKKHEFFLQKLDNVIFANKFGSVFPNESGGRRLFRKGILCDSDNHIKAQYMYNSPYFLINESRVLSDYWSAKKHIGFIWKSCENESAIAGLIQHLSESNYGSIERVLDWEYSYSADGRVYWSETWRDFVQSRKFVAFEHLDLFEDDEKKGRISLPFAKFEDVI